MSLINEGITFHEAIACGTGCDGVLGRRVCTRFDHGLAVGAPSVGVGTRSCEIRNDQEGQEEEGEEAGELLERARRGADEVKKSFTFPSQTRPQKDST